MSDAGKSHMSDSVDFKQLLRHTETLAEGDLAGPDGVRLLAYAPTLEALYAAYTQSAAHQRVRLHEYKRRMDAVRDAAARTAALQSPPSLPGAPPVVPKAAPEPETAATVEKQEQQSHTKQKKKTTKRRKGGSQSRAAERQAEREATESEMAAMAAMLRQTATRLRDTVREDSRVVDEIAGIVDQHTAGTRTQRGRLAQSAPPWWREMLWYIAVCVAAVVVFNVALFLTGLFGRHDAALCRPPRLHLLSRPRPL